MKRSSLKEVQIFEALGDEESSDFFFVASGDETERFDLHYSYCNYIYLF